MWDTIIWKGTNDIEQSIYLSYLCEQLATSTLTFN